MNADKRLWRTDKDGEFVLDSDPKAVLLAYGEGDEISADDEAAAKKALGKGSDKQAEKAQDKKADPPVNKSATTKKAAPRKPAKKAAAPAPKK